MPVIRTWFFCVALGPDTRLLVMVGILGAFTTFSTFGYETMEFLRVGSYGPAMMNVAANVVLGLLALWLGMVLTKVAGI